MSEHRERVPRSRKRHAADSFFVRFAQEYGWRAYAIPVLLVITIWVVLDVVVTDSNSESLATEESTSAGLAGSSDTATRTDSPNPASQVRPELEDSQLPDGGSYTTTGSGTYRTVGTPGASVGLDNEQVFRYVVQVEDTVDTTAYGGDAAFAAMVDATLSNPKSWSAGGQFGFEHVSDPDDADLRIQLSSTETTHELCGNTLGLETSCFYSVGDRVIINNSRWVRGAVSFSGDIGTYRQYVINHEVGHGLGFAAHEPCGGQGELAPIMMQQTISLSNDVLAQIGSEPSYEADGAVCIANAWPYPYA